MGKARADMRVGHFSQGLWPLLLAQTQPKVLSSVPYTQPYNGGALSQFSGVETDSVVQALSQSEVARV